VVGSGAAGRAADALGPRAVLLAALAVELAAVNWT
jgi:hypothetical protein